MCSAYRGKQRPSICGLNLSRLKYVPLLVFMNTSSTFVRKTHPHTFRLWERLNMHISDIDEYNGPLETTISCVSFLFLDIFPTSLHFRNDLKCCSISWTGSLTSACYYGSWKDFTCIALCDKNRVNVYLISDVGIITGRFNCIVS